MKFVINISPSIKLYDEIISFAALESGMCDIIKVHLKTRKATRSGKGNQPLNIKTAVERLILKLG